MKFQSFFSQRTNILNKQKKILREFFVRFIDEIKGFSFDNFQKFFGGCMGYLQVLMETVDQTSKKRIGQIRVFLVSQNS